MGIDAAAPFQVPCWLFWYTCINLASCSSPFLKANQVVVRTSNGEVSETKTPLPYGEIK